MLYIPSPRCLIPTSCKTIREQSYLGEFFWDLQGQTFGLNMSPTKSVASPSRLALLGATGNTGRMILNKLLEDSTNPISGINVYVRSRAKLERIFNSLSSDRRVTIFEGDINDERVIRDCIVGVEAIVCTLGENENIPGVTVLEDFATVTVKALSYLQSNETTWSTPRLIMLSSATMNPRFVADRPAILHWMIRNAFDKPYNDLIRAQEILLASPHLVQVTLIQPNALVHESATGCVISTNFAYTACSYEDLAEGFIQVLEKSSYRDLSRIGVSSRRAENAMLYVPFVIGKVLRGLAFQFIPGYWQAEYFISAHVPDWRNKPKKQ